MMMNVDDDVDDDDDDDDDDAYADVPTHTTVLIFFLLKLQSLQK